MRADEEAATELGISGVPFFVIDAKFAIAGAQHADVMLDVLERAWARAHPDLEIIDGDRCEGDACEV